jgi:hypothetical protein
MCEDGKCTTNTNIGLQHLEGDQHWGAKGIITTINNYDNLKAQKNKRGIGDLHDQSCNVKERRAH